jgi:hypothetical protein
VLDASDTLKPQRHMKQENIIEKALAIFNRQPEKLKTLIKADQEKAAFLSRIKSVWRRLFDMDVDAKRRSQSKPPVPALEGHVKWKIFQQSTPLIDALMAEIGIENEIQAIILDRLETAKDASMNLKKRDANDFVPMWERIKNRRMWRDDLKRHGLSEGFDEINFGQAAATLENKREIRTYGMMAGDGARRQVVAIRVFQKSVVPEHGESRAPGVDAGDVYRIWGLKARGILTDEEIRETLDDEPVGPDILSS